MVTAFVSWPAAPFTKSLIQNALREIFVDVNFIDSPQTDSPTEKLLQWSTYDDIDHERTHAYPDKCLTSSYIYRKALIRKHFLSRTIASYVTKHPGSILAKAFPKTLELEISFADELDELLADELWELKQDFESKSKKWWILKPLSLGYFTLLNFLICR
jgi:tubulin---tyrosine ligase